MARRISLLVAVVAALALVPGAGAATVTVKVGDSVDVLNTKIGCFIKVSANRRAIICELATTHGLIKGAYAIGISSNGDTVIDYVHPKGTLVTAVWSGRGKASARAQEATYYELKAGDSFGFQLSDGTSIACEILDLTTLPKPYSGNRVVCFHAAANTKPVPKSYGVILSNTFVGSIQFDAKGDPGPNEYVHLQPKK